MSSREKHLSLAITFASQAQELAGAGEYEGSRAAAAVSQAHAAIAQAWGDYEPPVAVTRPREPLPEWCGQCDGPEPGRRLVDTPPQPGRENCLPPIAWCPRCEPRSPHYQAAHPAPQNGAHPGLSPSTGTFTENGHR